MDDDKLNQIDRLFALKEKGVLSDSEFQMEKDKILGRDASSNVSPEVSSQPHPEPEQLDSDRDDGASTIEWEDEPSRNASKFVVSAVAIVLFVGSAYWAYNTFISSPDNTTTNATAEKPSATERALSTSAAAQPPAVDVDVSETELLKRAFGATVAKQGKGFKPVRLMLVESDRYAVIATAEGGEAHADAGKLAVQYAKRDGNNFSAFGPLREIETGSFGQKPEWSIRSDLGPNPMVVVIGGGTWQGCSSLVASLIELTPTSPNLLLSLPVSYENEDGDGNTSSYSGEIELGPEGLQVRYTGTVEETIFLKKKGSALSPQGQLPDTC